MWDMLIARKSTDGKLQSLWDHSKNVAEISTAISHYPNISKLLAYLHDLGKSSTAFQNYIHDGGECGSIIHAWQGAFWANEVSEGDCVYTRILKEIIGFCVTAHHNYLDDGVALDGTTNYFDKFLHTSDPKYSFDEIKGKISEEEKAKLQKIFDEARPEIKKLLGQIQDAYKNRQSANFALGLFVKYLFSCLVDADRLDAYLFNINEAYSNQAVNWPALIDIFEENLSKFSGTAEINIIRKAVSDKCKYASIRGTGIYQLSVPTGGGKTLSSLRFAMHHCKKHGKKRIIYVIPYLSIIEQTATNLRDILNLSEDNDVIFEHHSNIVEPEDEKSSEIRKLAAARWDSPIILTTMVQFMESIMSAKSGKLRKFASMADSVIIFDEIQSMPIKATHCFNEVVTFLSKILNATIILCSATQPTLESTQRKNLLLHEEARLIDCTTEFKNLKRVMVSVEGEKDCETASDFILEKANLNGNCLVIVNTKNSARQIYNRLKNQTTGFQVVHLSTSMYPLHRVEVINDVKGCLQDNKKIICISTQLIEAGVDISFSCVVRAMSGLDSIAQAAGRCNRNGESAEPKTVYTFSLKDENLDELRDIKSGKEITWQIVRNKDANSDLLDEEIMKNFYQRYFAGKDSQMDYLTGDGETVYAMLSGNGYGKQNHINRTGTSFPYCFPHAFRSADENFSLIDKDTLSVVVVREEAEGLIEKYRKQPNTITKEKIRLLNKLQKYSVSLYKWEKERLDAQKALYPLDDETGIMLLSNLYYSDETGVVLEPIQDNLIV